MIESTKIEDKLRTRPNGRLFHREGQELEFKEQFNFAGLAEYYRDFAAFANNRGGYLIFGVTDSPRRPEGLSDSALEQFEKIDPEKITGHLLEIFSPAIDWEKEVVSAYGRHFGVFRVEQARERPVIAKKDEGKQQVIKNGEVYYRYAGRTQKIQFAELESIIQRRIERNNQQWLELLNKIGSAGPSNAAILDMEAGVIHKDDAQVLVVDEELAKKLAFIKEGEFNETDGDPTLKLVGDVVPVDRIEVTKRVKENLTKRYPLSAMELATLVKERYSPSTTSRVWKVIADNDMKSNPDYSAYNFRNRRQEEEFERDGEVPPVTPSLYNEKSVDFIVEVLKGEDRI